MKRNKYKIHIVYAVTEYPSGNEFCGGAGNYIKNIATIMEKHGHRVEIVVEGKENRVFTEIR